MKRTQVIGDNYVFIATEDETTFTNKVNTLLECQPVNCLTLLVKYKDPPENGVRNDGEVKSFILNANRSEINKLKINSYSSCYEILKTISDSSSTNISVQVKQVNGPPVKDVQRKDNYSASLVIPHRGDISYLRSCINQIKLSNIEKLDIWIGFDEHYSTEHKRLCTDFGNINWLKVSHHPLGPYVLRNEIISKSQSDYIVFQDSDDIPCLNRFTKIISHIENSNADLIGCHELRLDELAKHVLAVRFPIDVSAALEKKASHPQFHPTTAARRDAFDKAGLFTTVRTFGADTQFLLRAYFHLKIKNLDDFLYIRRKRVNSLTTAPETKLESPERLRLDKLWKSDFELVKTGARLLKDSSLMPEQWSGNFTIEEIEV